MTLHCCASEWEPENENSVKWESETGAEKS